ncbi:MAG: zf-HC2 domain-containing protein [Nitrospirae bacterium]|nr:zf-HC2 domain-containing protein [Nitrospirota bacterium]
MDHIQLKGLLSPYRDGELEAAARDEVARHVAHCEECRSELAAWGRMAEGLFRRPLLLPPDGFTVRLMARLEDEATRSAGGIWDAARRWLVPALGTAVAAFALVLVLSEDDPAHDTEVLLLAGARDDTGTLDSLLASSNGIEPFIEPLLEEP